MKKDTTNTATDEQQIDWLELKKEQEVCQDLLKEVEKDEKNPLNNLMFGLGQPLKVYWQNGNFNRCRFEGYSDDFLFKLRMGFLIPHLIWQVVTMYAQGGEPMNNFYYYTLWSWNNAIISQILSLLAAWKPEYWHVISFAWLEVAHCLNLTVTFCFWVILVPIIVYYIQHYPGPSTWDSSAYFTLVHWTILHATPVLMTWVNIYYTDIKLLSADWKLMAWHGFFYMFANYLGFFDFDREMYPIIDWKSYPQTIGVFLLAIATLVCGFYVCFCNYAEKHYKRRGEM